MGINVAVTGLHAADNPAPGIGIIRALRHEIGWDGQIIGLAYDVYDTGIYDPGLLDSVFLVPYPNQDSRQILKRLLEIHERVRIDVLIPSLDSELALFQKLQPELEAADVRMYLPSNEVVSRRAKKNLVEFCAENDIPTPKTLAINNPAQLPDACNEIGFPLYVKGPFYDAYKCRTVSEAETIFYKMKAQWGLPILVQQDIDGEEFDVCAVGDKDGDLLGAVAIRKMRLTEKGKAWSAVTLKNQPLLDLAEKTLKALGWQGPCELEILQAAKTRELYLLEINPRFPAWIYLSAGCDQNLPKLVVDLALGKKATRLAPARSGVTFVRHATDLICSLDEIEAMTINGELHHHPN